MFFLDWLIRYISRVAIAVSILFNAMLNGAANQTFSARNWSLKRENKPNIVYLIDAIFFQDPDHCLNSWIRWCEMDEAKDSIIEDHGRREKIVDDEKNRLTSSRKWLY
jgi:hypothetical protein